MFDVRFAYKGKPDGVEGSLSECMGYIRAQTNVTEKHLRRWFWTAVTVGIGRDVPFRLSDQEGRFEVEGSIIFLSGENVDEEFIVPFEEVQGPDDEDDI